VSHPKVADLEALLEALLEANIEFIVVGGAAAVIHGAPVTTMDLDVIYRMTADNIDRLMALLERLDTRVRDPAGRDLAPLRSHLEATGPLLLSTNLGPLDPMATLADGRGYDELLRHSIQSDESDLSVRILDLETLIEVKTAAGRAKDRLMLPVLLALLDEYRGSSGDEV